MITLSLTFAQATPVESGIVRNILTEVQAWLHQRELVQWTNAFSETWLQKQIGNGHFYVVRQAEVPVAVFRLLVADPVYWGHDTTPALYLHTLAVARTAKGQGIGKKILDWAAQKARAEGKTCLRLDCLADNPVLISYYADYGFVFIARKEIKERKHILYELPLVS